MPKGKRPGIMIYFDIRPALNRLYDDERGKLLLAMLDYGEQGIIPDFSNDERCDMLEFAWEWIMPKLDHDGIRYEQTLHKNEYAAYCSVEKRNGKEPRDYDGWLALKYMEYNRGAPLNGERLEFDEWCSAYNYQRK